MEYQYNTDDIVETFGDDDDIIRLTPLEELSEDLLVESINWQIEHPFSSKTNFLEEFIDEYDESQEWLDGNDDALSENKMVAYNFYRTLIKLIDKKFGLEIDYGLLDNTNLEAIRNMAEGLYTFFIIKYEKNITKYLTNVIMDFKDAIVDNIVADENRDTESVSYISYELKLDNPKYAFLFTETNEVINQIKTLDLDVDKFIDYFNAEKFEVAVLKYGVDNFIIIGDFVPKFLDPIFGHDIQDDIYDSVLSDVRQNLFKKLRKENIPSIDELEEMSKKGE